MKMGRKKIVLRNENSLESHIHRIAKVLWPITEDKKENFEEIIRYCYGNIQMISDITCISVDKISHYIKELDLVDVRDESRERISTLAEKKLIELIQEGDIRAIQLSLKSHGDYIEKSKSEVKTEKMVTILKPKLQQGVPDGEEKD